MSLGASFTFVTLIVSCLSNERAGEPLSVTRTQIRYERFTSKLKLVSDLRPQRRCRPTARERDVTPVLARVPGHVLAECSSALRQRSGGRPRSGAAAQ